MSDSELGIEIGRVYVFRWQDRELTGVAVAITGRQRWVTLRTRGQTFQVPPQEVLRAVED